MPIPFLPWLIGGAIAAVVTAVVSSSDSDSDDEAEQARAERRARTDNGKARKEAETRALVDQLQLRLTALLAKRKLKPADNDVMVLLGDPEAAEQHFMNAYLATPEMQDLGLEQRALGARVKRLDRARKFLDTLAEDRS